MDRDDRDATEPSSALPWAPEWSAEGVIEVLEPLVIERRRTRVRQVVDARLDGVTVVMDAPHDPHNGAALIRSCDAFGVARVHVVPRDERFLVASGVTKGTDQWVEVVTHASAASAVDALRRDRYTLVATHPEGRLEPADLSRIERLALVLGNEHDGICEALSRAADETVAIPMRGFVESLNVSVAGAILLQAATCGRPGDLSAERHRLLYAVGLYRSVQRARDVLAAAPRR